MNVPKFVKRELMKAFKNYAIDDDGWFPVWDDKTNEWLANQFGIYAGPQDAHKINDAFKVRFNWNLQIYYVSA